jgi:hypothetical protein
VAREVELAPEYHRATLVPVHHRDRARTVLPHPCRLLLTVPYPTLLRAARHMMVASAVIPKEVQVRSLPSLTLLRNSIPCAEP